MSGSTVVVFVSKEGEEFEVPLQAARLSKLVDDVVNFPKHFPLYCILKCILNF